MRNNVVLQINFGLKALRRSCDVSWWAGRCSLAPGRYGRSWILISRAASSPGPGPAGGEGVANGPHAYATRSISSGPDENERCLTVLGGHN